MSHEKRPAAEMLNTLCPMSRRQMLRGTAVAAGGAVLAATALTAPAARAQAKVSQASVHYQTTPKDGHACNSCVHFQAPSSCNAVDGTISPSGWCTLYQQKS